MSGEELSALKEQLANLTSEEKLELARFLEEEGSQNLSTGKSMASEASGAQLRAQRMAWLKAHREEYAGQYVALDESCRLVGVGSTIREAHEQARRNGVEDPFLTHISSSSDATFGGW